jgi:acetyl-CoA carboxylase carboxyltransferase component
VLANDPNFMAGSFNYDVAEKFTRFIDMCDTFHLPIVNLSDQPGFTIGKKAEEYGTIRKGVRVPVEGGVYAAHRAEIEAADDPKTYLNELQDKYRAIQSPFRTAEAFGIEDIIDPRDTRPLLCDWIEMAYEIERKNLGVKKRGMRC